MLKNILVAVDPDERTEQLIDYAAALAIKFTARVWIVHIAASDPDFVGYEVGPQYIRDMRAEELRAEHRKLQRLSREMKKKGIASEALLIQGPTTKMILDEAHKLKADLIIVGAHEHSFLHNAFIGSTALQLFKETKIPLLAIPLDL